jgi:hypothetical protein
MDVPTAPTGTVHPVSASNCFVVLKAVAVKFFPLPGFRRNHIFNPAHKIWFLF